MSSERAASIVQHLQEQFPAGRLPVGTLRRTARIYGVTPERVRQLARRAGFESEPRRREVRIGPLGLCPCGAAIPAHHRYCASCRYVALVCTVCGREFRRARTAGGNDAGPAYCSRRCYGRMVGREYGFGSPRRRDDRRAAS